MTVHETESVSYDIGESADELGVLGADHQALHPLGAADQVVHSGFQQGFEGLGEYRSGASQRRHMKPCNEALAVIQRTKSINTALKAEIEVEVGGLRGMLLECRKRDVMACADGEQLVSLVASLGENSREIVS